MKKTSIVAVAFLLGVFALALAGQRITVESQNGRYKKYRISIGRNSTVKLVSKLSNDSCNSRTDWGWDSSGIWVDNGCRAVFEIRDASDSRQVTVESQNNNRRRWNPNRDIDRVTLVRQLSDSPCTQGRSWGYNRDQIWVDRGCRAVFNVQFR